MEIFSNKNQCCGCTACKSICPKNAISMQADNEGFLYPIINKELCINCGLCKKVCAFQNGYTRNSVVNAYAVKHHDIKTRLSSRSGGAFIPISDYIIQNNGTVYGAAFNEDFSVSHIRAESCTERDRMKGSKYVQSELGNIFLNVQNDLKDNRYVMFSGTACQVAGLNNFLEKSKTKTDKLFTVDLVCHGVPSNKIWTDYLDYINNKHKGNKITDVNFRDKSLGWDVHFESFCIDGKKNFSKDYAAMFYQNDILLPSYNECKYTNLFRPADFTLADFWGIDNQIDNFNDNKGVSLFIINSQKAQKLFELVKNQIEYINVDINKCTKANPNLRRVTPKPDNREDFWKKYHEKGFSKTFPSYKRKIIFSKIKHKLFRR